MTRGALRAAISKGRVIEDSKGKIDLSNEKNASYLEMAQSRESLQQSAQDKPTTTEEHNLKLETMRRKARLLQIQEEKLNGELIPTELVKTIFSVQFQTITKTFYQAADQMSVDWLKRFKGDPKDLPKIKADLIKSINGAVDRAKKESSIEIKNIVNEFSEKRGKGERKS